MVYELYPYALAAGLTPEQCWELSYAELQDVVKAYNEKSTREFKQSVQNQFLLADVITKHLFQEKDDPIPRPWDYYPKLFSKEKEQFKEIQKETELEDYKERRRQYVAEANRRRRGE